MRQSTLNIIDALDEENELNSVEELEAFLARRYTGVLQRYDPTIPDVGFNHFWLGYPGQEFPQLGISVFGDLAYAWYVPHDGHPGFNSIGDYPGLDRKAVTTFYIDDSPGDAIFGGNEFVITLSTAFAIARDFLESPSLPRSIEWFKL